MWVVARWFLVGLALMGLAFASLYQASAWYTPKPWGRFYSSYVSFNIPPNWRCELEGTEWVCRSTDVEESRRAIIVMTAKAIGENDNFEAYMAYLETPQHPNRDDGTPDQPSRVLSLEQRTIGDLEWVVSIHHESLVPGFESQYYATIAKDIAVLLTFSYRIGEPRAISSIGERIAASLAIVL